MTTIHSTAIVSPKAQLGEDVTIGPFSIIEENVSIGNGCEIHSHVLVANGARIGNHCKIHHGAVISTIPQDLKFGGEETTLEIGDYTVIREFCDLNRGTRDRKKTVIGEHCFIMAYTHVAHDCWIGNRVIMSNGVQLAGHVTIQDWVILSGLVPVHQFCMIGEHTLVSGGYRVTQNVPPFILAAGDPLTYKGINMVGLKRRGFSQSTIASLKKCYRILYRSKLNKTQAVAKIKDTVELIPEIKKVIQFIEKSERGVIR